MRRVSARRTLVLPSPLDVAGTVRSTKVLTNPALRWDRGEILYASRTADGPATLHARRIGERLEAEAWGPGAERLLERLPGLIGLEDHEASAFCPTTEPLRTLQRSRPGLRVPRTGAVFEALAPAVLGQKVLGKEAGWSWRRLCYAFGEPAPGPLELQLPPSREVLRSLAYEDLHRFGIERRRAELLLRVAARANRFEEILEMPRDAAYARLQALPGLGPWTAAKVMFPTWGDADAVPVGDYNAPSLVSWNLIGERRGNDELMLELLEPYRGHRARVLQLLGAAGTKPPRRGPRRSFQRVDLR